MLPKMLLLQDPQKGFHALAKEAQSRIPEVTPAAVRALQSRSIPFTLIDVREKSEFDQGHIPGAIHLSKGVIERDIEQRIPNKGSPLILYCQKGFRSVIAADNLRKMGYANLASMVTGIEGWRQAGYPVAVG